MKKTVQYRAAEGVAIINGFAWLHPVNHPDLLRVSNTRAATTSKVISVQIGGKIVNVDKVTPDMWETIESIETQNTIYVPV